ncbi:MAG: hypothetical protein WCH39_23325 [Schlesneria sp.]
MQSALAIVHGGRVELIVPNDWPEGLQVQVTPLSRNIGIDEANYPTTPDGIQHLIAVMDKSAEGVPLVDFDFDSEATDDDFQKESVRASWLESVD